MRQPLRPNPGRSQTAMGRSIPAPTGGWDAQTSLADMPPDSAVILDNFIPRAGYVEMRRGYAPWSTGAPGPVLTLLPWRGPTGDKLFCASGSAIYDATTANGTVASVYTGLTSAVLQSVSFANDAGVFTIACNGVDTPIHYDGTSWTSLTISSATGSPVTLNPRLLINVMAAENRLFFIESGTLHVWFLAVQAIQGTASLLDLGMVFDKGGYLSCMGVWTLDGGNGPQAYSCFMTTQGQVAVYQGVDPSQSTTWSLVGVFNLGQPLSPRAVISYGADLAVITTDGVVPLSKAARLDRSQDNTVALTAKIHDAFQSAARAGAGLFGWSAILYAAGSLAIINVPQVDGSFQQYVQNMQTGAWCRFLSLNARCWAVANGLIYFGGPDGVYQWDVGSADNGGAITGDIKTAFNAFQLPGRLKRFNMVRPLMKASTQVQPALLMLTDYRETVPSAVSTTLGAGDVTAADASNISFAWQGATGEGYVAAARMRVSLLGDPTVYQINVGDGTDVLIDAGDYICERPPMPFETPVQVIGFDLQFQMGGQL